MPWHNMKTDEFLSTAELALIRQESLAAESRGALTDPVLELIYARGWLRVLEPAACNGLEWELPRVVRLFEALAYADGNVGWCVNLGAGANLFAGYLATPTAKALFSDARTWCAGSGAVSGKAGKAQGGFWLSGEWKYASGAAHATHFTCNAFLLDEDHRPITAGGKPVFRSFIVPAAKVQVHDSWHVTGLKATSSHDFRIDKVFVPDAETFSLCEPSPFAAAPLFRFPFEVMAVVNMAVLPIGMALHLMELFKQLMATKKPLNADALLGSNEGVQAIFRGCKEQLETARKQMYQRLDSVWDGHAQGGVIAAEDLDDLREKALAAVGAARWIVHRLLPLCGMNAVFETSAINKVWRDISVGGQHYLFA